MDKGVPYTTTVLTSAGLVRGLVYRGVELYRGTPYGDATEGARRFRPPRAVTPWNGARDAISNGPRCVQPPGSVFFHEEIGTYFTGGRPDGAALAEQWDSENCLNLNVITPGQDGRRPVMVYIHGGGFMGGSGVLTAFGDALVSREDVVLVGINHRLNVFGYLYLGGLDARYREANVGQLDLVLALRWVRENIARFGGDPENVTIFGESGGGAKISALMAMPSAQGLFRRAIVESGSALQVGSAEEGTQMALGILGALGLGGAEIDRLQEVPATALHEALFAAGPGGGNMAMRLGPVIDGVTIPGQTWSPQAPALSAGIPMIIGNCKDEGRLFAADPALYKLDEAELRGRLEAAGMPAEEVPALLTLYRQAYPSESPADLWFRISTDRGARWNATAQAERQLARAQAPVYLYCFRWDTPSGGGRLKAWHTAELPLVMGLVAHPEARELSRQLGAAWAAFARSGDPSQPGLPWPAYTLERRATMVFDAAESGAVADPDGAIREALRGRPSGGLL